MPATSASRRPDERRARFANSSTTARARALRWRFVFLARARALLQGRDFALPDDVRSVAPARAATSHRLFVSFGHRRDFGRRRDRRVGGRRSRAVTIRDALLRARRRPRHLGAGSPTIYRGDGYEFVELRAYVPGDDVRRIDWASTARSGELQTRVVLEDVTLTLAATIDTSSSMRVGRHRALVDAAREALSEWFGAAHGDDRCMRIANGRLTPPALQRGNRNALLGATNDDSFDLRRNFRAARAALPRGAALLAIGDWYDLDASCNRQLADLGARFDCTALIARDPWYHDLPLSGIVRLRGAEGGSMNGYVGKRERRSVSSRRAGA